MPWRKFFKTSFHCGLSTLYSTRGYMMQSLTRNPIQRPLPDSWIEHFDSQRNLWYYVDLNSDPPRVTLVHPCELNDKHPSSAPAKVRDHGHQPRSSPVQRPIGPRQSASTSANSNPHPSQRPRRATVAQQLYASSLNVGPKDSLLGTTVSQNSSRTPHYPSGSSTPVSDDVVSSSSSPTAYPSSSSASSATRVSPTSLQVPSSPSNPRICLDYTRLTGTRRVTYSGPQPFIGPRSSGKTLVSSSAGSHSKVSLVADAFYPGSVKTSLSSSVLLKSTSLDTADNHIHLSTLSALNSDQMNVGINSDELPPSPDSSTACPHLLITAPTNVAQSMTSIEPLAPTTDETSREKRFRGDDSYSSEKQSSVLNRLNPSPSSTSARPLPPTTKPPSRNNSSPASETILQPKPMRPLAGVSLNLQVQVAGVNPESSPDHLGGQDFISKKKRGALLQNLTVSLSKNAKGKTPIRTIYDRQLLSSSPVSDDFAL